MVASQLAVGDVIHMDDSEKGKWDKKWIMENKELLTHTLTVIYTHSRPWESALLSWLHSSFWAYGNALYRIGMYTALSYL